MITMDQTAADTVVIDCSAFEKQEGTWTTIKATELVVGRDPATAARLRIEADVVILKNYYLPAGIDLLDLLESRCGPRS
jgi:hypothetical protein